MTRTTACLLFALVVLLAACTFAAPEATPTPAPPSATPAPSATPVPLPSMTFEDPASDMVDCAILFGAQNPQGDLVAARAVLEADHLYLEVNTAAPLENTYGFSLQVQVYTGRDEGVFAWDMRRGTAQFAEVALADGAPLAEQPANLDMAFDAAAATLTVRIPYARLQPPYAFILVRSYFSEGDSRPQLCDNFDLVGIHTLVP